jgi:hypothetical protein
MKANAASNRAFVSFPQLSRLVTTTNFIDKKTRVREPLFVTSFQLNQLSKVKTKELG